jgi:hypothetical protein
MMASRGMGDISPSKMPMGKRKARRDDTDFTQYKEGEGKRRWQLHKAQSSQEDCVASKSRSNATGAGQWSARKAQLVAKKYKAAGGGYRD